MVRYERVKAFSEVDDGVVARLAVEAMVRYERMKAFSETAPELFDRLPSEVYACYYQDARVLEAIGVGVGAPFPRGNTVEPGDLSLLDPVARNKTTWRRTHN